MHYEEVCFGSVILAMIERVGTIKSFSVVDVYNPFFQIYIIAIKNFYHYNFCDKLLIQL